MATSLRDRLRRRASLLAQTRRFFDDNGFIEVQPRCVTQQCVVDPYIDPLETMVRTAGGRQRHFLQPSPEAEMKQLLAGGSGSIYAIGPAFRDDESGPHHRPEFTMLEWYEVGADGRGGISRISALSECILGRPCHTVSYRDLFTGSVGLDPIDSSPQTIATLIEDASLAASLGDDRDDILDAVLSLTIMPTLVQPTIVYDYPISQAALAKPSANDDQCAARFEWFAAGVELGNGYDELLDADVLVQRTDQANVRRVAAGRSELPPPASLIQTMRRGMPASAGVAVGLDRLLMVADGETSLSAVLPSPT